MTPKYDVVELDPEVVTGRRFRLQRPEPDHHVSASHGLIRAVHQGPDHLGPEALTACRSQDARST